MKKLLLFGLAASLLTGCFKEINEADDLTSNIFDRDYTGERWFELVEANVISNALGQIRVRVDFEIPIENLPELRSSIVDIAYDKNLSAEPNWGYKQLFLDNNGGYSGSVEFPQSPDNEYCLSLGFFIPEEDSLVINDFKACF